jgi:chemotaxis protein CheC
MAIALSEMERDALGEAFNMALGEAASSFADLVHEEITITVPSVELLARSELTQRLMGMELPGLSERLTTISQNFHSGDALLNTEALLLFGERGSLEIVRRMLGEADMPLEDITELEQDALGEVGNIIINSCMSTLSSIFGTEMIGTLPDVTQASADQLFHEEHAGDVVLMVRIGMGMQSQDVTGYVLFLMDLPSLEEVVSRVRRYFGIDEVS